MCRRIRAVFLSNSGQFLVRKVTVSLFGKFCAVFMLKVEFSSLTKPVNYILELDVPVNIQNIF